MKIQRAVDGLFNSRTRLNTIQARVSDSNLNEDLASAKTSEFYESYDEDSVGRGEIIG